MLIVCFWKDTPGGGERTVPKQEVVEEDSNVAVQPEAQPGKMLHAWGSPRDFETEMNISDITVRSSILVLATSTPFSPLIYVSLSYRLINPSHLLSFPPQRLILKVDKL